MPIFISARMRMGVQRQEATREGIEPRSVRENSRRDDVLARIAFFKEDDITSEALAV